MRFTWSFEHQPQTLRDEVLELAAPQRRLRLGPAIKIIRNLDRRLHGAPPHRHKTINPYLRFSPAKRKCPLLGESGIIYSAYLARGRSPCLLYTSDAADEE